MAVIGWKGENWIEHQHSLGKGHPENADCVHIGLGVIQHCKNTIIFNFIPNFNSIVCSKEEVNKFLLNSWTRKTCASEGGWQHSNDTWTLINICYIAQLFTFLPSDAFQNISFIFFFLYNKVAD